MEDPSLLPAAYAEHGLNIEDFIAADGTLVAGGDQAQYLGALDALKDAEERLQRRRDAQAH